MLIRCSSERGKNDKHDQIKIVIRHRVSGGSSGDANEQGTKGSSVRTVEERKEFDRARAHIFRSSSGSELEDALTQVASDVRNLSLDENEVSRNLDVDVDSICSRDTGSSLRVAIFRDREKDRTDPDYDRSYKRYAKALPTLKILASYLVICRNFSLHLSNMILLSPSCIKCQHLRLLLTTVAQR